MRVVVLDEDDAVREALRLLLEDAGHHMLETADAPAALAALRACAEPCVALFDVPPRGPPRSPFLHARRRRSGARGPACVRLHDDERAAARSRFAPPVGGVLRAGARQAVRRGYAAAHARACGPPPSAPAHACAMLPRCRRWRRGPRLLSLAPAPIHPHAARMPA